MRRLACFACFAWLTVAACPAPAPTPVTPQPGSATTTTAAPADAPEASEDEKLAAIQKAMNELDEAAQQCWAAVAVERFDIEGDITAQIDIEASSARATVVGDTARNPKLTACLVQLLGAYRWAPPLHGQSIQLPFRFRAPDGQNVIDRRLVPWNGQGGISVAVLLDESNSGNDAGSILEVAIDAGKTTGPRQPDRTEVWYFLTPAKLGTSNKAVAAGDMVVAPKGSVREIASTGQPVRAVVFLVPGGREGSARAGALPAPNPTGSRGTAAVKHLPASAAKTHGPAQIFAEPATTSDKAFAASVLTLAAGSSVPEHVHANETELLYVLSGSGTMTIKGVEVAITPMSVVQVPPNTKHAFKAAAADVRSVQLYTPAGPEQRFKAAP